MDLVKQDNGIAHYRVATSTDVKAVYDAVKKNNLLGYEAKTVDGRCFKFNEEKARVEKTDGIVYFDAVLATPAIEEAAVEKLPEKDEVKEAVEKVIEPIQIQGNKFVAFREKIMRLKKAYQTLLTQNIDCKKQLADANDRNNDLEAQNKIMLQKISILEKEVKDNNESVNSLDAVMADFDL